MDIGSEDWGRLIVEGARALGADLGPPQTRLFAQHARELLQWNRVTNLTSITAPLEVALNHFVDSLAPARLIPSGARLIDVGSGGGFPGLPLHVAVPGLKTTLVDASRKKVSFLRHVIRTLGLEGIDAVHRRVEEFPAPAGGTGAGTIVVSRAFSAVAPFLRMTLPLIDRGGKLIALKGGIADAEFAELEADSARGVFGLPLCFERIDYRLPGLKACRTILVATPARPAGGVETDGR